MRYDTILHDTVRHDTMRYDTIRHDTWSNHIDYVVRKASKAIGLVSRNKHSFNRLSLIKLFNTLVRPIIEYGSVVYDNLTLGDSHKLEMLFTKRCFSLHWGY